MDIMTREELVQVASKISKEYKARLEALGNREHEKQQDILRRLEVREKVIGEVIAPWRKKSLLKEEGKKSWWKFW